MKNISLLALALVFTLLAACAQQPSIPAPTATVAAPTQVPTPAEMETPSTTPAQNEAEAPAPRPVVRVAALKGPTAMGMVGLMSGDEQDQTKNDYTFTLAGAADELTAMIAKDELDIAALPCNVASVLYNKTEGSIRLIAVNTLGVLYVLENGDSIESSADLKGKTIALTGKGTTPEYTLRYLLAKSGLKDSDVTLQFASEATEIAALLEQGAVSVAMLPEPYVTSVLAKNPGLRVALDVTEEWELLGGENGGALVTGTVIVRKAFLEENKALVDEFLNEYKASIEFVQREVAEAAKLIEKYGIVANAAVAEKALPNCNIVFETGGRMQQDVESYLTVLFEQNPQSVGGKLPDDAFYYMG